METNLFDARGNGGRIGGKLQIFPFALNMKIVSNLNIFLGLRSSKKQDNARRLQFQVSIFFPHSSTKKPSSFGLKYKQCHFKSDNKVHFRIETFSNRILARQIYRPVKNRSCCQHLTKNCLQKAVKNCCSDFTPREILSFKSLIRTRKTLTVLCTRMKCCMNLLHVHDRETQFFNGRAS